MKRQNVKKFSFCFEIFNLTRKRKENLFDWGKIGINLHPFNNNNITFSWPLTNKMALKRSFRGSPIVPILRTMNSPMWVPLFLSLPPFALFSDNQRRYLAESYPIFSDAWSQRDRWGRRPSLRRGKRRSRGVKWPHSLQFLWFTTPLWYFTILNNFYIVVLNKLFLKVFSCIKFPPLKIIM